MTFATCLLVAGHGGIWAASSETAEPGFTESELKSFESSLRENKDFTYLATLLDGDRQRTIALLLAARKGRPADASYFCGILQFIFARDQFEARPLPPAERQARYKSAFDYLRPCSDSLQVAVKAHPTKRELKPLSESLHSDFALAALEAGELSVAKKTATDLLKSESGDALYAANTILGRAALREGNIPAAKEYLLASSRTSGSLALNSFGPSFILDHELLEKGETAVVLEHLDLVSHFWGKPSSASHGSADDDNAKKLARWKADIAQGKIPTETQWQ